MLNIFTVAFFGHRYVDNIIKVEDLLEEQIRKLIDENEYVDFLVGRNGDFDQCVSSSVLRVRKNHRDDNSALALVLPYPTAEYLNNENYFHDYYTDIEISHAASVAHPKSAIQIRNREMLTVQISLYAISNTKMAVPGRRWNMPSSKARR